MKFGKIWGYQNEVSLKQDRQNLNFLPLKLEA